MLNSVSMGGRLCLLLFLETNLDNLDLKDHNGDARRIMTHAPWCTNGVGVKLRR